MSASFSSVSPPPVSHTRQNLVDSASVRKLPVTAAEKKASTKSDWQVSPSFDRHQTMAQYVKAETGVSPPRVAQRYDPVAILDQKLNLWV